MTDAAVLDSAAEVLGVFGEVRLHERLARHTTFGIGGPADVYLTVSERASLAGAARATRALGLPLFILGSGSNLLVGDEGVRGVVIENNAKQLARPQQLADGRFKVTAESGASFAATARRLCREGFWGLEWAVGIPGTLGGAVVYNAGAYGGCLADVLTRISVLEPDGRERDIEAADLRLEYRGSVFTRGLLHDRVILAVECTLRGGEATQVMAYVADLDTKRLATQPRGRNAGSIFKNPADHPAWWLIDQVGLRGAQMGAAEITQLHANFFANTGAARARDVKALMDLASQRVWERFGISLHPEVNLVGEGF